jgi:2-C-methyl-D-erythritol 4-phosphate cytidylyltransferase
MVSLAGHPLISHSLAVLSSLAEITDIVVVGASSKIAALNELQLLEGACSSARWCLETRIGSAGSRGH